MSRHTIKNNWNIYIKLNIILGEQVYCLNSVCVCERERERERERESLTRSF